MPAGIQHYPDPDVRFGHFRVLPRTDGGFVVVDTRVGPPWKDVKRFKQLQNAAEAAKKWHEEGR